MPLKSFVVDKTSNHLLNGNIFHDAIKCALKTHLKELDVCLQMKELLQYIIVLGFTTYNWEISFLEMYLKIDELFNFEFFDYG